MQQEQIKDLSIEDVSKLSIDEIVELYNPANAQYLSEGALSFMPKLSAEHIKALAAAYPNKPTGNTYLILKDTKVKNQIYQRSTWSNLQGLRTMAGLTNFVALSFASRFKSEKKYVEPALSLGATQDLTKKEVATAPGLTTALPQTSTAITQTGNIEPLEAANLADNQTAVQSTTNGEQAENEANKDNEMDFPDLTEEAAKQAETTEKQLGDTTTEETGNTVKIVKPGKGKSGK